MINNGLSALLASQRALQVTSNNIANSNTEGYIRQRPVFTEQVGTPRGGFVMGQGVTLSSIDRIYDQFLIDQVRTTTSLEQRYDVYSALASRVNGILGNPDTSTTDAVQRFFAQVETVSRDPTSTAMRQQLLLEGDSLADRLKQLDRQLSGIQQEVNLRLGDAARTINRITGQIADLNDRISAAGNNAPADLLDRREVLLRELAGQVDIITTRPADGTVTVMIGSGQALVLDNQVSEVSVGPDDYDGSRLQLALRTGTTLQNISGKISGGIVGGLLAFRDEVLDGSRQELGRLATGIATAFNEQHREGLDFTGQLGGDFFGSGSPAVGPSASNTGTGVVTATIADASALAGRDYELRYTASGWLLTDRRSGAVVPTTGSGTLADPLLAEGLSLTATAGVAVGDRYLVRPTATAVASLRVLLNDPQRIAAARPLQASVNGANTSTATIGAPAVADINDPKLLTAATIVFNSPTTYSVFTGGGADLVGPLPYTSGGDISFAGWTVQVTGTPATGDRFAVTAAGPASGDNGNALLLGEVPQQGFFANGTVSLYNLTADIIATTGSIASRSSNELAVQTALLEQARLDVESVSGVNLEEEAANLLRYQESYLAASKVIGIANDLFATLLQIAGR
jgi:flagellar hook-associated protein 1 FlgK